MMTMMIRVVKTACSASGTMPRKITKPKGEKMMIGTDVHGESMYIVIIIDEHWAGTVSTELWSFLPFLLPLHLQWWGKTAETEVRGLLYSNVIWYDDVMNVNLWRRLQGNISPQRDLCMSSVLPFSNQKQTDLASKVEWAGEKELTRGHTTNQTTQKNKRTKMRQKRKGTWCSKVWKFWACKWLVLKMMKMTRIWWR